MKKTILFLIILFAFFPVTIFADESIPLKTTIENINNPSNIVVTYQLKENGENAKGATNVPEFIEADFSGVEVVDNKLIKIENDSRFGSLTFCGTKKAISASGIKIVESNGKYK